MVDGINIDVDVPEKEQEGEKVCFHKRNLKDKSTSSCSSQDDLVGISVVVRNKIGKISVMEDPDDPEYLICRKHLKHHQRGNRRDYQEMINKDLTLSDVDR